MKTIIVVFALFASLVSGSATGQYLVDSGTPDMSDNVAVFYFGPSLAQILAQKFTLTQDATVTKIEAFMNGDGQAAPIQLVNRIGPGATAANLVAEFTVDPPHVIDVNSGTWVAVDVDLFLPAGDYYLVFSDAGGNVTLPIQAPNDIGTSYLAGQSGNVDIAFPPDSPFMPIGGSTLFGVRVTGTAGAVPGSWADGGFGLAGAAGTPDLVGAGPLVGNTLGSLTLRSASPSAPCLLEISMSSMPMPFKGGLLVPVPALADVPQVTSPDGSITLLFRWPMGIPSATSFWLQDVISDAAAIQGVSLSNAVVATTP